MCHFSTSVCGFHTKLLQNQECWHSLEIQCILLIYIKYNVVIIIQQNGHSNVQCCIKLCCLTNNLYTVLYVLYIWIASSLCIVECIFCLKCTVAKVFICFSISTVGFCIIKRHNVAFSYVYNTVIGANILCQLPWTKMATECLFVYSNQEHILPTRNVSAAMLERIFSVRSCKISIHYFCNIYLKSFVNT